MQNLGVKSIQTHSARSVENTCPSSPYKMAEKKNCYSVIRIEVVHETVRVWKRLCQVDIKKFVVARRKRWGKISVRSPLGVKKRSQIGLP